MKFEIKCRFTAKVLFMADTQSFSAAISLAVRSGANLSGANLSLKNGSKVKIKRLIGQMWRINDPYEFAGFETNVGLVIYAGCRKGWTLKEYTAHVKNNYSKTKKGAETLAILKYFSTRLKA